jgi:hypothetical protein
MPFMRRRLFSLAVLVVTLITPLSIAGGVSAQAVPVDTINVSVSVRVDGVSKNTLYGFLTNLENDALWYPGIISSEKVKSGPRGRLVGSRYHQVAYVTPTLTTNTDIDVLGAVSNNLFLIKGDGDLADYTALYTFSKAANGSGVWTLTAQYKAPGFTEEIFRQYITFAMNSLIAYYNTTGEVTVHYLNIK